MARGDKKVFITATPGVERSKRIFIQQDNTRPHILPNDSEFGQHGAKDEFDIRLICKPPNSSDMNILDLVPRQSSYYSTNPSTIDGVIKFVTQSFNGKWNISTNMRQEKRAAGKWPEENEPNRRLGAL